MVVIVAYNDNVVKEFEKLETSYTKFANFAQMAVREAIDKRRLELAKCESRNP